MPSVGKFYNLPYMRQSKTVLSVCALAGLELEIPEYKHFEDNKKPEFLAKFPIGKIPAFEGANGLNLSEGAAIARYLAGLAPNSGLLGTTPEEAALVDQWVHFAETEIAMQNDTIWAMVSNHIPYNKGFHTKVADHQMRSLTSLETYLSTRTFLVGERITLADITAASVLQRVVTVTADAAVRSKLVNTIRFLETIVHQPKLEAIFGPVEYVEKALQWVPPKKEKEPAPPAAPKEKKEKEKPKKVADDDDEDDNLVPEEPKAKNPLDLLPKSPFNLEDWKRAYSNKDTRGTDGSLEWFYANFDKEGFSVWRVDFKYNEELTLVFMSSNQIGGFFNRLEASRKYLFGSVGVLGENNASIISGALILRGQDAKPVVDCAPDFESYEYKKLDVFENQEDKTFFEGALAWDLEVSGKKWADGKNFK
ncbi:elongation factor 1-gamma [Rhizopogon vinicolor AM-OR11-026]|uniref:Elongation factor 1-gamma n=1 Tax=Rhizopogon vinicolor AM-OR11-026 TaxID=1314800 RepID=A0A1B7N802_9AGAM|nr:elongation factor 1-gamma [Rhizopogon vinicolor AM-OR11-026]